MASNKGQAFMGLAVLLGVAAAVAAYFSVAAVAKQAGQQTRQVVVTTTDLTFGVKLEPSMLHTVRYPKESVPAGAFSSVDSVAGQTTKVFMSAREPVTAIKLSSRGGGLSLRVRPEMRAVSLEVNQVSGVSGFVLPGDKVDVLVTVDPHGSERVDPVTHTLLQNIEVLAAGQKTQQESNKPITVQAVTLLVDPPGAEQVAHAQHEGEITLVLRNPEDSTKVQVPTFSTRDMLGAPKVEKTRVVVQAAPKHAPVRMQVARKEDKVRIIRKAQVTETPAVSDTARAE